MSVLKGVALLAVSVALQGAPQAARAATADCGRDFPAPRLIGLDRTEADVCSDRFALTPEPPSYLPPPAAVTSAPVGSILPLEEVRDGTCARFVPTLGMTVPVACRNGENASSPDK